MRRILLAALLPLAVGCSSLGGGGPREDLPPPPEPDRYRADLGVQEAWSRPLGRLVAGAGLGLRPAVAGGLVYVVDADGQVQAFDVASGEVRWQRALNLPASAGPAVGGDLLVLGTREGQVIALRASDGEPAWQAGLTGEILAAPAVGADTVVVRVADGRVFGLDAASGARRWLYEQTVPVLTLRGTSSPLLVAGQLAVVGLDTGRLVALAPDSGRPLWEAAVAVPRGRSDIERIVDIDADPVLYRTDLYAASYNGRLASIDAASGRTRWDREASVHAGLAVDAARVYLVDADRHIWAFDRFSGAAVWRQQELRGLRLTGPAVSGEYVLVGDDAGYLNWLSVRDGSLQRRQNVGGAFVAAPLVEGDGIYLLTEQGLTVLRQETAGASR